MIASKVRHFCASFAVSAIAAIWLAMPLVIAAEYALASTDAVWKGGGAVVRLHASKACNHQQIIGALRSVDIDGPLMSATVKTDADGSEVPACWGNIDAEKVLIVDIFGRGGYILKRELRPAPMV